ncbi:zinc metallopeptidase [Caldisalinibacter kiritimatiensis]|uniref:Putative metal-dependent peptidase n=1 Tax=Caldisalinibacter kiritimatiensis TaxID=1304284 RepID=R1CRL6_9FIRM|nr:zinc metallopeptidase [Caldisalinibacter kiritimatiensis]EOD01316.1 Putative metal-dependent peptidase [Caldisalinibacter kiritimatiensis]
MYYPFGFYFDPTIILLIPAILFATYAQTKVKTTFNKYLRVGSRTGYTGAQVARMILDRNDLHDVRIEHISGKLTDHYDPRTKVLRLSSPVYNGTSLASQGVAAHEVGHAIQHANGYFPLVVRNSIAPVASFSARFVWILIIAGLFMPYIRIFGFGLLELGIVLYLAVVLFQVITLPVEFNASSRALAQLEGYVVSRDEIPAVKKVLDAAALTYVAATLVAVAQLMRLLVISGRRD